MCKIKSSVDVITNSSSEVFIIKLSDGQNVDEILDALWKHHEGSKEDRYSGDSRDPEVWSQDGDEIGIALDEGFTDTSKFLQENYEVLRKYHI